MADVFIRGLDDDLKRMADADSRSLSEFFNSAGWKELGGKRKSAVETRLEHKETRISQIQNEIEDLQQELAEEEAEKEALENQLEELDNRTTYQDDLGDLFNEFANSRAVLPRFRGDAQDLADQHGKTLSEIERDLRDLADESDHDIDEDRWTDGLGEGLA